MIVATAGHVDHGKSTLIKALTGIETDRLAEEKRRGLSIDLGFAYHDIDGQRFGFVDVPGHEKFIRNMLSGVSAIDAALLVVAADDGVMPQTREHFDILRLLGIPSGVIALTKIDLADSDRIDAVEQEVRALVDGSFLAAAPIVRMAAHSGTGVSELRAALAMLGERSRAASTERATRMTIDRAFVIQGVGLTVTGTVIDGHVSVGDRLRLFPVDAEVRVRAIRALDVSAQRAETGERCAVSLSGVERGEVSRGAWLLGADNLHVASRVDVGFTSVPGFTLPRRELRAHVHAAASHVLGRMSILETDGSDETLCQLVLEAPLPLRYADALILRDAADAHTIGRARVIDTGPPARGRARPERLAQLRALDQPTATEAVRAAASANATGVAVEPILAARGLPASERAAALASIEPTYLRGRERWAISPVQFDALREAVLAAVTGWHKASPHTNGIRLNQLQQVVARSVPRGGSKLLAAVIDDCVASGKLIRVGGIYRIPDHAPSLVGEDRELWDRIRPILAAGRQPPVTRDVAQQAGVNHNDLLKFLGRIAHLGLTVKLADNRYFLPETVDELLQVVRQVADAHPDGHITPIAFRDASGIGRNLAIAVLEHLDTKGITRRHGDYRVLTGLRD